MNTSLIRRGEIFLALGIAGVAFCSMLMHLVILGLLAFPAFPGAIGFFLLGAIRARDRSAAGGRQVAGFLLLVVGLAILVWATLSAVGLAREAALHASRPSRPAPSQEKWLLEPLRWFCAALPCGIGLWLWASWPPRRCVIWSAIILLTPPAALFTYRILAPFLPIDA